MRRFSVLLAMLAVVFVSQAGATEATIYPGVGIGRLRLGMTKAQVARVLGSDSMVNSHEGTYTELAWDFATWTVGFVHGRAVQIGTTAQGQRTKRGIGPGSTWRALMRVYPGGRCTWNVRPDPTAPTAEWPEYLVPHAGGSQTLYVFRPVVNNTPPVVLEVAVRTAFRPLPEFAPSWGYRCAGDWRHASSPAEKTGGG